MSTDDVLAALVGPPTHGFAIARRMGGGQPEGTVYPVLHRLERDGMVRSAWSDVDGRRRRVYQLTAVGATAAASVGAAPRPARRRHLLAWAAAS